jgi:predicted XRE-type DNA-binding protein
MPGTTNRGLSVQARFKLQIMQIIHDDLEQRFVTVAEAAEHADIDVFQLSKLRAGQHEKFSINWLFNLADKAGVKIRITVRPAD